MCHCAIGSGALAATDISGTGTAGAASGGRAVSFGTETVIQAYAREIAADSLAQVRFLRGQLPSTAVIAQPAIDLSVSPTSAFSVAARRAGIIAGTGDSFDPYASVDNFLIGAFLFKDVAVTAYKGAAPLIFNKTFLESAAGIMATHAYHAATIRTLLYRRGQANAVLIPWTTGIAAARDALDGAPTEDLIRGIAPNDDQGVAKVSTPDGDRANIVPSNSNGITFSRTPTQVLNIVYLNAAAVTSGGFFPSGVNGTAKTSAASG